MQLQNNVTIDGKSDGFAVTGDKEATDFNINIGFINYAHVRTLAWFDDNQNQLWDNSIDSLIEPISMLLRYWRKSK